MTKYLVAWLLLVCLEVQPAYAASKHHPPKAVGSIPDQTISVGGTSCGPLALSLDLTPYFDGYGEPLTYCLSHFTIDGSTVEHLEIQLNPYTGLLTIPIGWFAAPYATIELKIIAKNPFGSAAQQMQVTLAVCGG